MKKPYIQHLAAHGRRAGLTALLAVGIGAVQAQTLPYSTGASSNSAGTYTDLGTGGTAIATPTTDDANSAATLIGFPFVFNGTTYNDFVLNTNGLIKLGTTAPAAASYITYAFDNVGGPVNGTETNVIMPFNVDLVAAAGSVAEYRMLTTGTSPNRVCTIQWKNVADKPKAVSAADPTVTATQYANMSFQVKLYETTNTVQFVYGAFTRGVAAADNIKFVNVGVKGSGTATDQLILVKKASVSDWSAAFFLNTTYQVAPTPTNTHNVRGSLRPDSGRTYSIAVPVTNDVATAVIYGFGKVVSPAGSPVVLRALVRNAGTAPVSNVSVTLTVSLGGVTTFTDTQTVPALGTTAMTGITALVTFAPVPLPNPGNYTVTVTVAPDGNNTNNALTQPLIASPTDFSFIIAGASGSGGVGFAPGSESGFGAKFTLSASRDVTAVRAYINDATPSAMTKSTVGETLYGAIVDATTGAVLARSANYVVRAADVNAVHTFPLVAPYTLPAGDFIAGMVQVAPPAPSLQFFPMGLQAESPTRTGTFFRFSGTTPNPPADAAASNFGRYMLEAVTATPATCPTPGNIAISGVTTTSASVAFTVPSNGTSYQVVYVPAGSTPTATSPFVAGTASPISLTSLTPDTPYDIYVRALCGPTDRSQLAGPVFFSTPCTPPIVNGAYSQNFDVVSRGQDLPCGITVLDANNDSNTWGVGSTAQFTQGGTIVTVNLARSAPNAMVYFVNSNGNDFGDDWFFLPAIRFQAGSRYRLAFWYRGQRSAFVEKLEVKYGTSTLPADQTNLLYSNTAISSPTYAQANNASAPVVADITPTTTGLKYIGFHAFSDPDQLFLAVDDITVSGVLATSAAMNRAVSIYPNPSNTGSFNLEIHGANAKDALQVEVTNMLGQRVYAGAAKDNFSNQLDLSNLANGIYTLKVRNGAEYMQQQLSIVK